MEKLEILYQDDWLVAVNKPSGLLVHRTNIDPLETRFALQILRRQVKQRVYPVHRLDKPTSGVLLFALTSEIAGKVGLALREGRVQKKYLTVARGITDASGCIDYALVDGPVRGDKILQQDSAVARPARTDYRTLGSIDLPVAVGRYASSRYSLVEARPETGRRHQLRRHFKHISHPLIGDTSYGDGRHNQFFRQEFGCHRLLLHAASLGFSHPQTEEMINLEAGIDEIFSSVLGACGWKKLVQLPAIGGGPCI